MIDQVCLTISIHEHFQKDMPFLLQSLKIFFNFILYHKNLKFYYTQYQMIFKIILPSILFALKFQIGIHLIQICQYFRKFKKIFM